MPKQIKHSDKSEKEEGDGVKKGSIVTEEMFNRILGATKSICKEEMRSRKRVKNLEKLL